MKNVSAWWTPPPPPNQTKVWEEVRRCSDQYAPAPGGALTGDAAEAARRRAAAAMRRNRTALRLYTRCRNRAIPRKRPNTTQSTLEPNDGPIRWYAGASWFIDISHGGTPNLWRNICHFSNSMLPFFEACRTGAANRKPLGHVFLWQVDTGDPRLASTSFHGGLLGAVLSAARTSGNVTLHFDEELPAGTTVCFEEAVVVNEPNLQHRSMGLQTRASMTTAGVARGFTTLDVRWAFRRAVLAFLRVPPPRPRVPTITYLSRPLKTEVETYGKVWQMRCHVGMETFRTLKGIVYKESKYELKRAVFERTTYAHQAAVISQTDVFWSGHGAGMVHMPLLPPGAVVVEMFNCGHFSYLYANYALNLKVRYFAMQRTESYCYRPTLKGDTRRNISKTYRYTLAEAEPMLMQAVRYHMWSDPVVAELSGKETVCESANRLVAKAHRLPPGMAEKFYAKHCAGGAPPPAKEEDGGGKGRGRRIGPWELSRKEKLALPEGNGLPGQWTRWAGNG